MTKIHNHVPPAPLKRRQRHELPRGIWLASGIVLVIAGIALAVACAFALGFPAAP